MERCVDDGCCTPSGTAIGATRTDKPLCAERSARCAESCSLRTAHCPLRACVLDSPALRRTATVVRDWRHVLDGLDVETARGKRADGRLASRTRSLDLDVDGTNAVLLRELGGILGRDLGRERSAFARALE